MGNIISKLMDGLFMNNSVHEIKCFLKKSNDSYVSCTKRNAILIFCQKHALKYCEDEVLKTFKELAQTSNMQSLKIICITNIIIRKYEYL